MNLTMSLLNETVAKIEANRPDRCEIIYNPLTRTGKYGNQFGAVEKANAGPVGPLMKMVEMDIIPEGMILVYNRELFPREPLLRVFDFRTPEDRSEAEKPTNSGRYLVGNQC